MALELVNPYGVFYKVCKDLANLQITTTLREYGMRYRKRNKPLKRK